MKNPRIILAVVYIPLAFVLAFAPIKTNKPTILSSVSMPERSLRFHLNRKHWYNLIDPAGQHILLKVIGTMECL